MQHLRHPGQQRVGLQAEEQHLVDGGVGVVEHVVDGAGEREQVLAVDGRDEGAVELVDEQPALLVALLLGLAHGLGGVLRRGLHELQQAVEPDHAGLGLAGEPVDERVGLGLERVPEEVHGVTGGSGKRCLRTK
ncbi:MAG: hypothetical protein QM765_16685 [Myxococcales bacterium]